MCCNCFLASICQRGDRRCGLDGDYGRQQIQEKERSNAVKQGFVEELVFPGSVSLVVAVSSGPCRLDVVKHGPDLLVGKNAPKPGHAAKIDSNTEAPHRLLSAKLRVVEKQTIRMMPRMTGFIVWRRG